MEPIAINTYLLKIASFCNLNCSYCFMFNLQDMTYRGKPRIMSLELVETAAAKMVELARAQGVRDLHISFHGGEPLLAGKDWFHAAVAALRRAGGDDVAFGLGVQTNGVLIDDEWLDLFERYHIDVGVSLDGPKHVNDRARLNFAGDSSYDKTVAGLRKLQSRPGVLGGVLCVIDPETHGLEVYRHFRELGIRRMDFLWPLDHNWNQPPPSVLREDATPYADYLIPIFDEWWRQDGAAIHIRYFESILRGLLGSRIGLDSLGANPINIVAIDTDGSIEPLDSLRAGDDGLTDVGLRIQRDPLSALYDKELFKAALAGASGLCGQCKSCVFADTCGGGYLPHHYSRTNGFDNPSVYCRDLWKLINHVLSAAMSEAEKPYLVAPAAVGQPTQLFVNGALAPSTGA